jgi:hypothetical protein
MDVVGWEHHTFDSEVFRCGKVYYSNYAYHIFLGPTQDIFAETLNFIYSLMFAEAVALIALLCLAVFTWSSILPFPLCATENSPVHSVQ